MKSVVTADRFQSFQPSSEIRNNKDFLKHLTIKICDKMFANIVKNIFLHDVSTFPKRHYQVIKVIKEVKLYSII